jgi:hypothetical protein
MNDFQPGEVVNVTIKGARVNAWHPELGELTVEHDADVNSDMTTFEAEKVDVERVASPEWPPLYGDLWRDRDGDLWLARTPLGGDRTVGLVCSRPAGNKSSLVGGPLSPHQVLKMHGPMVLVHREEVPDAS